MKAQAKHSVCIELVSDRGNLPCPLVAAIYFLCLSRHVPAPAWDTTTSSRRSPDDASSRFNGNPNDGSPDDASSSYSPNDRPNANGSSFNGSPDDGSPNDSLNAASTTD